MTMRAAHFLSAFLFALAVLTGPMIVPAGAQENRSVVRTEDADYFGFDLRFETDVTLDACEAVCLADGECRAFTYNTRAQRCFLKSDYSTPKPFVGAVAGKVVTEADEPDLGAPPALSYVPDYMNVDARRYRADLAKTEPDAEAGIASLAAAGREALDAGNAREAVDAYKAALAVDMDDPALWTGLSTALIAVETQNYSERAQLARDGGSAALNAYALARSVTPRAQSLAAVAGALDRRELSRPALQAYEASLALVNDAGVRAAYADLKSRKGFRVLNHTVDADLAEPRVCVQFSEDLVKSGIDYASFVTVDDAAPKAVSTSARQICVEGLEHGEHYRIAVRQGLPAAIGEVTESPVALSIYVRDRAPTVRFSGENFVLPASGRHGLPMVSINAPTAKLKLHRIGDRALAPLLSGYNFLNQLSSYNMDLLDESGELVWEGEIDLGGALNEEVLTSFPVDEALPERKPGVYVLVATPEGDQSESWQGKATQWFVVSDIGLSTYAGEDGLTVFARSLSSAKPLAGATLQLLARNNEILGEATTDARGRASFTPGLMRGASGLAPAGLTAKGTDGDFVFLDMTRAGFDLSDRGVTGRAAPGAVDVFAWTERGIYRAGETVHAAALARDDASEAVENLPLTFVFTRPDGVEERRVVSDGRTLGGHHVPFALQPNAMLGTWALAIHTDPKTAAIARINFLVEQFVPDRIEFDLEVATPEIAIGETAEVTLDGRYLYGAPAEGLELEGEVSVGTKREWDRFPGYRFGLADEEVEAVTTPLALDPTDEDGHAAFEAATGTLPFTTRLHDGKVTVRMREGGGRAVERSASFAIRPEAPVIGIRPDFSGTEVAENATAGFRIIAVTPQGEREAIEGARWTLTKIERNYQWYRSNNYWNYEAIESESRVADGRLDIAASGDPAALSLPVGWGRYRLDVESGDPAGPVASFSFNAGWFVEATSTETPDGLEIALDKDRYAAGDVARLKVSPRFAGELLVTVGAERLYTTLDASVPEGGAEIEIPVTAEWGAGAYVTATLYRPGEASESRLPARAIGVKWLAVEPAGRRLDVALGAPERAEPRAALTVPVALSGLAAGEEAFVTVAAVDVGILNLTRYKAPDPSAWYFGQRRLGLELRDLYGRLIDGSAGAFGRLRTGGDGGGMTVEGSPPTEKLVAFFSGPVEVDAEGKAEISFDIPEFNGTARIMAVAWTKKAVGQASADVVIRDPLVVTAGQPRFLATGDRATIRLDIHNTDGPAGDYTLAIGKNGTAGLDFGDAPQTVSLDAGQRTTVTLPVTAGATGDAAITVSLVHAEGATVERTLYLPVRQPAMPLTSRRVVSLAADGGSIRIDGGLLADSLLDGASVAVGVSHAAAFDVPSLMTSLDRYPYGCSEQTTSRALPLLYAAELSAASGMEVAPDLKDRIDKAIARIMTFQTSSGNFGLWAPAWGDPWLDAYITEFLTRAREAGHTVPAQGFASALDNLQNQISYNNEVEEQGSVIAYALYVLARNRKASIGDLRYYADARIDEFSSPMARAQLAAALALYGDNARAEKAFASALEAARSADDNLARSDYGSSLRDGAAILALAAEVRPAPAVVPALARFVAQERQEKDSLSTQEQVWLVLAARAVAASSDTIRLDIGGAAHEGAFATRIDGAELIENPLVIANRGGEPVDAVITTVAAPAEPLPAGGEGFALTRTYYTLDGEEANVTEVEQNDRFVVVLTIESHNEWPARIALTDLLPAGFEIDNPRLVGSAELGNFDWLGDPEVAHSEFRDDRFVVAFDADGPGDFTAAYVVRAITPGTYAHPAAVVEDMYRPQFSARTAAGIVEVTAPAR